MVEVTAIPRDMLPLDMLNRRYAIMNCGKKVPDTLILVIYLPPAMLFLIFFFKKIPDMLILVIYLPPAMLFLISQKIPDMLILVLYLPLTMPL